MSRPPLPPFTAETAAQKARMAEDAWNTPRPGRASRRPIRPTAAGATAAEFIAGPGSAIEAFLHPQMEQGARLPPDQGGLGVSRQPHRRPLRLRMARRQRQLVSQLRQRELGVRRARLDAAAHRQHQRPRRSRTASAKYHWPLGRQARRSSVVERARALGHDTFGGAFGLADAAQARAAARARSRKCRTPRRWRRRRTHRSSATSPNRK